MQFYLKGLALGIAEKNQWYAHRCDGSNPVSVNVQKTKFKGKAGSSEPGRLAGWVNYHSNRLAAQLT
jgi:hypothetical protein